MYEDYYPYHAEDGFVFMVRKGMYETKNFTEAILAVPGLILVTDDSAYIAKDGRWSLIGLEYVKQLKSQAFPYSEIWHGHGQDTDE